MAHPFEATFTSETSFDIFGLAQRGICIGRYPARARQTVNGGINDVFVEGLATFATFVYALNLRISVP